WALGFQLSRWDYSNLTHMKTVVKRNIDKGVPLDVQFNDIDYMDLEKDFTIDPINYVGLNQFYEELHAGGIRTIIILDPAMNADNKTYQPTITGIAEDVFIKWNDGRLMKGACWPGEVYFPDFFLNQTQKWWARWIKDFRTVHLTFDGLWIDMNEPALFGTNEAAPWNWNYTGSNYTLKCPVSYWDDPPYRTKAVYRYDTADAHFSRLSDHTLCMVAPQGENRLYRHYDVHSLYGWSQTKPTLDALQSITGKRGLVLTRSTFFGSGQWGAHWLGDNEASWHDLKRSMIGMIEFNWFGIPFVGADICGFDKIPTEELCTRWMQVGAFYPFSRNHNIWKTPDQDPGYWSDNAVQIMINALNIRYTLLPYYYTLFFKAHTLGDTVIRPLFHGFSTDPKTLDVYLQFLVGSALMITPVTDNNTNEIDVYIPSRDWYDYYNGKQIKVNKETIKVAAPLDTIPIFLRGGYIIPTQQPANNTKYSRQKPFGLIIALNSKNNAHGELFYDDGDGIDTIEQKKYYYATFNWHGNLRKLTINVIENNYLDMKNLKLDTLHIYGLNKKPKTMFVNKKHQVKYIKFKPKTKILIVKKLNLDITKNHTIIWKN
ncbi:unnamed protein product, partial [Didymodactylos carnosus]